MQRFRHRGVWVTSLGRVLTCLALLLGACGTEPADGPDSGGSELSETVLEIAPSTAQPEPVNTHGLPSADEPSTAPPTSAQPESQTSASAPSVDDSPAADGESTGNRSAGDSSDGEGSEEESNEGEDQASDEDSAGEARESGEFPQVTFPEATVRDAEAEAADLGRRRSVIGLFERLRIEAEHRRGYDRDAVFRGWLYSGGQSTRDRVLVEERQLDGSWTSAYDAVTVLAAADLDIDHLVPLAEAWESGGHAWTPDTWTRFANDLDDARSLIAVSQSTNRSKGARDPNEWWPPQADYRCQYAADWIAVKTRWSLAADSAEQRSLDSQLDTCEGSEFEFRAPVQAVVVISEADATQDGDDETPDADAAVENDEAPNGDCHPAYEPCLPNLPGDALNCGDLSSDQKPVRIRVIGEDPYGLDRDRDGVGCQS